MKHIIRLILVVSLLLIALLTFTASAAPADFTYTMKGNGTAIITGYKSNDVNVYIPKMLDGYTVSTIADNAFEGNKTMMTVNIPDTVTSIGDKAFFECEKLNGVTIPASVQSIGIGAFAGCDKGLSFAVDKANPVYTTIDQILYNKKTKTLVCCPRGKELLENTIPNGIIEIGEYSFYQHTNELEIDYIPNSIDIIKSHAFEDCEMVFYEQKLSVDTIESYAFSKCQIEITPISEHAYIQANYIREYAFYDCQLLLPNIFQTECELEVCCPVIENSAFENVKTEGSRIWISIRLPQTVKIGSNAFKGSRAYEFYFSDTLVEIGDSAFENAYIIQNAVGEHFIISDYTELPDSLVRIGERAFAASNFATNTVNLINEITLPLGLEFIGEEAFYSSFERTIIIPESVTEIGDNICDRKYGTLEVVSGSYAATYAAENGYKYMYSGEDDLSWLN